MPDHSVKFSHVNIVQRGQKIVNQSTKKLVFNIGVILALAALANAVHGGLSFLHELSSDPKLIILLIALLITGYMVNIHRSTQDTVEIETSNSLSRTLLKLPLQLVLLGAFVVLLFMAFNNGPSTLLGWLTPSLTWRYPLFAIVTLLLLLHVGTYPEKEGRFKYGTYLAAAIYLGFATLIILAFITEPLLKSHQMKDLGISENHFLFLRILFCAWFIDSVFGDDEFKILMHARPFLVVPQLLLCLWAGSIVLSNLERENQYSGVPVENRWAFDQYTDATEQKQIASLNPIYVDRQLPWRARLLTSNTYENWDNALSMPPTMSNQFLFTDQMVQDVVTKLTAKLVLAPPAVELASTRENDNTQGLYRYEVVPDHDDPQNVVYQFTAGNTGNFLIASGSPSHTTVNHFRMRWEGNAAQLTYPGKSLTTYLRDDQWHTVEVFQSGSLVQVSIDSRVVDRAPVSNWIATDNPTLFITDIYMARYDTFDFDDLFVFDLG